MRTITWWLVGTLAFAVAGCSGGSKTPLAPDAASVPVPTTHPAQSAQAGLGTAYQRGDVQESALALYTLELDPAALTATISLKETRQGQANDDLYQLSIDNFLRADSVRVRGISATADTIDVSYVIEHPFPAPADPTGTPNGFSNRSDLGIAGMVLFLLDVPTATGNTYFTNRIANTETVANADAYYSPAGLLTLTATANTFPYKVLVDELADARLGVSNTGQVTGNYGSDGWTRAEYGGGNNGWTGYGVLHQGQSAMNTVSLNKAALGAGLSLDIAVIAKYNDPRGGTTGAEKRGNRLPPATPDHTRFAYRMPHGALDVESIVFLGDNGPGFDPGVSGSELRFAVVDWDANATETSETDLALDATVTNVAQNESGNPALSVDIPGVLSGVDTWADTTEDGVGSGVPGDPLTYTKTVSKTTTGTSTGTYTGMVRAADPETGLVIPLDQSVPPLPLSSNLPEPVAYQAFQVDVVILCTPPSGGSVTPSGNAGCPGANVNFSVTYTGDPAVSYSWNFGGGATPNTSSDPSPAVALGSGGSYNGSVTIDTGCPPNLVVPFSFSVSSGWNAKHLVDNIYPTGRSGWYNSGVLLDNGNPAIAFLVGGVVTGDIMEYRLAKANVPNPTLATDWTVHTIATMGPNPLAGGNITGGLELRKSPAGRLIMVYRHSITGDVHCAVSTNNNPSATSDWATHPIFTLANSGWPDFGMTIHNGTPAICFRDGSVAAGTTMHFARSSVAHPSAIGDWTVYALPISTGSIGFWSDMHSFDNGVSPRLAIAFRQSFAPITMRFRMATVLNPASVADWGPEHQIGTVINTGSHCNIKQFNVGGNPRLVTATFNQGAGTQAVNVYVAQVEVPASSADWSAPAVLPLINNGQLTSVQGSHIHLLNFNNRVALAYSNPLAASTPCGTPAPSNFNFALASGPNPASAGDFAISVVDSQNTSTAFDGCNGGMAFVGVAAGIIQIDANNVGVFHRDGKTWIGIPDLATAYHSRSCPIP